MTDVPIQGILDHLVTRIADVLPGASAGVTLLSPAIRKGQVAASSDQARGFEAFQAVFRRTPSSSAYATGEMVAVPDLRTDKRFRQFATAAYQAGVASLFSFPLRHSEGPIGALNIYLDAGQELSPQDLRAAQTLADVTAAYARITQACEDASAAAARLQHSALHDALTGLANRVLLAQRVDHAAERAKRTNTTVVVLFADLDHFKRVNDSWGHAVGDELLVVVAQRLSTLIRPGDTLARVSGDEFVLLYEDVDDQGLAEALSRRVDGAFVSPFQVSVGPLDITASVGVAFAGPGQDVSNQLIADAGIAMYQAKRKGGARHQAIDLRDLLAQNDRNSLERDLRLACAAGELSVAYQPIVQPGDGHVTGVEALLRWTHPERGPIPALSMIAIAEQSDLIQSIGTTVLECACRDRSAWLADHPERSLDVAVNVSVRQLMMPGFLACVTETLNRTNMDPRGLVVEVTESLFIDDGDRAITILGGLRSLGIRIALDDFGTGYSSLSYLRSIPIDIIKIDQTFTSDICRTSNGRAIVAAMTKLAQELDLTVIAEGVETAEQRDTVVEIGCEAAQGYYFARPMTAAAINELLANSAGLRLP